MLRRKRCTKRGISTIATPTSNTITQHLRAEGDTSSKRGGARSSENEAPGVMEARRLREEAEGVEGGEFERSLDMIGSGNGVLACLRRGKNVYLQSQCAVSNVFFMRNPRDVSTKDDDKQIS